MKTESSERYETIRQQLEQAKLLLENECATSRARPIAARLDDIIAGLEKAEWREQHSTGMLSSIRRINRIIVSEDDPRRLIDQVCSCLTESGSCSLAWVSLCRGPFQQDTLLAVSVDKARHEAWDVRSATDHCPACGERALALDETVIVMRSGEQCSSCLMADACCGDTILIRRLVHAGKIYGILGIAAAATVISDEDVAQFLEEVAGDLSFALYKFELADELRLKERDNRHAQLLAQVGPWRFDLKTGQVIAPEITKRIYGLAPDEPLTIPRVQGIPVPADRGMLDERFRKLILHGAPYNVEFRIRRPSDGAIRVIHSVAEYDGDRQQVIGSIQDITERRRAEEAVSRDRKRLRTIIEGSRLGTWEWEIATGKISCNEIWAEQLGYGLDELEPLDVSTWERLVHPEDWDRVSKALKDCFDQRTDGYDCEHRLRHKNGRWVWILDRGQVVSRGRDGRPLLMFGTHVDVTRLKVAEEQAKTAAMRLHEAVRAAHVGLWDWNLVTNSVFYSREWKEQIGYREDEIGTSYEEWEGRVHPDDLEATVNQIREAIQRASDRYKVEFRFRHKNGSYRWILAQSSIIVDAAGAPLRAIGSHIDITDRKEAEEALRQHDRLQRTILQTTGDGYWLTDDAGNIIDVNEAACRMSGYTREELLARTIGEIDTVDSEQDIAARMERIRKNGHELFETWHRRKDGKSIPLEISTTKIESGKDVCFVCFFRDLTERRQAEEHLRAAHVRLEALWSVSSLSEADSKTISDQICESVTRMTNSLFGFYGYVNEDESEMTIHSWSGYAMKRCALADQPAHFPIDEAGIWAEAVRHRHPFILNNYGDMHPAKRGLPGGHVHLSRLLAVPLLVRGRVKALAAVANRATAYGEDDVSQVQAFLGSVQAIIDRQQAQQELRRHQEMLANVARMVPGFIYQYRLHPDGSSSFPYASPGIQEIAEITPDEVRDDASLAFSRLHPEDRGRLFEAMLVSERDQQPFHHEFRVVLPRKGIRWLWAEAQPQLLDDGSTLWYGIMLDITEQKQAEEAHAQLRQQLVQAQKMESVGRLAGGVAHDFNNMLGVILGYSEMALEQIGEDSPVHPALSAIRQAALRSSDLTRQLLAFARKQTIEPRIIDLNKTIKNMLVMLRRLIGEDIELVYHPHKQLGPVFLDPAQVDQILANLCVNARDAIGGNGAITISTSPAAITEHSYGAYGEIAPGDYVVITVSDTGCGMDAEIKERLFEPFFTTKQAGEGTGLGLATVFGIVKQNKGFIEVESAPGMGTSFKIGFSLHLPEGSAYPLHETGQDALPGSETILLVEDEAGIRQMTARMLDRLGYRVIGAAKPGEAIELVTTFDGTIDLLITDVIMPEMNGRDLAGRLQAIQPDLKCLYISGYTADVLAPHGVLVDGSHFLQKPFSRVALSTKIRAILDGYET